MREHINRKSTAKEMDPRRREDRISKFPDEVLCHILSFCPTKFAVMTGVLSKRWKYLWTSVPCLHFEGPVRGDTGEDDPVREDKIRSFVNFVNGVLVLNNASYIRKFCLQSYEHGGIEDPWIRAVLKRNVQELDLHFFSITSTLPSMLFACTTLVCLKLCFYGTVAIPNSVLLPNLKILHLCGGLSYVNELLSGCPSLKEMTIRNVPLGFEGVMNIDVSSPTLTSLTVEFDPRFFKLGFLPNYKYWLNVPNLQFLHLKNLMPANLFLVNLSSLVKVIIGQESTEFIQSEDFADQTVNFLVRIAHIQSLSFSGEAVSFISQVGGSNLPTFHNLSRLELGKVGLQLLMELLQHAPNLEVLVLREGLLELEDEGVFSWSPPQRVPPCLSCRLKMVKISEFGGLKVELKLVEYFLKNSNCLDVVKIVSLSMKELGFQAMKKLLTFPRLSTTCQVVLPCLLFGF